MKKSSDEFERADLVPFGLASAARVGGGRSSPRSALRALPARRPDVGGSAAAALGALGDFSPAEAIERAMLDAARKSRFDHSEPELMAAALHANRARRAASTAASREEAIQ